MGLRPAGRPGGRERIIFGADLPYYDYRLLQQIIEQAPIDDDLKDRIAYRNMLELIRQYNPEWRMPTPHPPRRACIGRGVVGRGAGETRPPDRLRLIRAARGGTSNCDQPQPAAPAVNLVDGLPVHVKSWPHGWNRSVDVHLAG